MSSDAGFESAASRTVDLFSEGLSKWGIELSASERSSFSSYAEMLVDWNKNRFNLTRLTSPEQIALNHFLDSVVLTQIVKVPVKSIVIDVGTGAGFPGRTSNLYL
jgi:16S rRNA (guanine527-N7)-methyltransferase